MNALQFVVQGGNKLSGTIRPSGNKNAALPIVCAALLTEHPVILENVPRIRDVETLVELVATLGVSAKWAERNTLHIHAKTVVSASLDPFTESGTLHSEQCFTCTETCIGSI